MHEKGRVINVQISADDLLRALETEDEEVELIEDEVEATPEVEEPLTGDRPEDADMEALITKALEVLTVNSTWEGLRDLSNAVKEALETRSYADIDGVSAWHITKMIDAGTCFIECEDPADVEPQVDKMCTVLLELVDMLKIELAENPAAEGETSPEASPMVDVEFYTAPALVSIRTTDDYELRFGKLGDREVRTISIGDPEVAPSGAGNDQLTVTGYASVYDQRSLDLGFFTEFIAPGAFDDVLSRSPDVHLLWDHDTRYVLARTKNGTLDLTSEDKGLRYWARMAGVSYAQDLAVLLERGDIDQASFAFTVEEDEWEERDDKITRRILKVRDLYDVTITARGAYPQATSELVRDYIRAYGEERGLKSPHAETRKRNLDLMKSRARVYRALHEVL